MRYRRNSDEGRRWRERSGHDSVKRNPAGRLRDLERRAEETGSSEDVLAYATALLRAGQVDEAFEPFVLAAQELGSDWFLVPYPKAPNFILGRLLPGDALLLIGWPDLLSDRPVDWSDVEGEDQVACFATLDASWLDLPAERRPWNFGGRGGKVYLYGEGEFRMPPAVNRMIRGEDQVEYLLAAARALVEPGPRLLGVMAWHMDLGHYPRALFPVNWFVDYLATEEGFAVDEDPDYAYQEIMQPLFYRAWIPIERDQRRAVDYVDSSMRTADPGRDHSVLPLHGFDYQPLVPFPHLLREFGFEDESSNLDPWATAVLPVGRPPNLRIEWDPSGINFELDEAGNPLWPDEEVAVIVRCMALNQADSEEWVQGAEPYSVHLGTTFNPDEPDVFVGTAENESALNMILANLGL